MLSRHFRVLNNLTQAKRCYGKVTDSVLKTFESICGASAVSTSMASRDQHGHDESYHTSRPAAVVLSPNNTKEVSEIVKVCAKENIVVIPFGTGTGMEGGVCAVEPESVCLNLNAMTRISEPNIDDFDVVVEAGVTRHALNHSLKTTGLYFPIDPGADASLCGMCATGASGTMAVKYGTMRHNVLNLEVVLPNGEILDTAGKDKRARKSSAGYNLTSLFIGSEGTLGVITKATLRLHPQPENKSCSIAKFPTARAAIKSVVDIMKLDIPVARIEFIDEMAVEASNKYSQDNAKELSTLMFEVHGSNMDHANEQLEMIGDVCSAYDGEYSIPSQTLEEMHKMWHARHAALYAAKGLRPGSQCVITDVCVPLSKLPDVIDDAKLWLKEYNLIGTVIGHVGDGNFHVLIPVLDVNKEVPLVKQYTDRLGRRAIELGGTCTGEHGIGLGKRKLLVEEMGPNGIALMKTIKKAVDPQCIMNPTKVFEL